MPKRNKKAYTATDQTADDFDDMLAELRAADLTAHTASETSSSSSSASSTASSAFTVCTSASSSTHRAPEDTAANAAGAEASEVEVSEAAIMDAVRNENLVALQRWAGQGVRITSSAEALYSAVMSGNIAVLRCLVRQLGADVNQEAQDGFTALITAVTYHQQNVHDNLSIMQCLVQELGADVNKSAKDGLTPLYIAAMTGKLDVVRFMANTLGADVNLRGKDPLFIAAHEGHVDVVRCLVNEFGVDVNRAGLNGVTALFMAAQEGLLEVVRCLLEELGADDKQATYKGRTPLMAASHGKHAKIIKLLIKFGADAQASTAFGTAAYVSKKCGAPEALTQYLEAKAHCSNPGCSGAGLKKCTGCKQARYCGQTCQLAHWRAHKVDCKASKGE
jgi:ankyrin repeat protein